MSWIDYNIWRHADFDLYLCTDRPGASVGGMCACRCSGSTALRYGSMRENVLNLTAVLVYHNLTYLSILVVFIYYKFLLNLFRRTGL